MRCQRIIAPATSGGGWRRPEPLRPSGTRVTLIIAPMAAPISAPAPRALPLPIAALLRKAHNSEETKHRHDSAWAAWEASVRLAVAAEPPADAAPFALPSLGHWVAALPRRDDRLDDPDLLAVAALLAEVATGKASRPRFTTPADLLARLAPYRNPEVGHGAPRGPEFYGPAAEALLAGVEKAWALAVFWPSEAELLHVGRVEIDAAGARRARVLALDGLGSTALGPTPVPDDVLPGRLYRRDGAGLRPLHPWLVYQASDVRERVLFFNGIKNGKADYLDYTTGEHVRSADLAEACPSLAADLAALFPSARAGDPGPQAGRPEGRDLAASPPHLPVSPGPGNSRSPLRRGLVLAVAVLVAGAVAAGILLSGRDQSMPRVSANPAVQAELERAIGNYLEADIAAAEESFAAVAQRAPEAAWPHLGLSLTASLQDHFEDSRAEIEAAEKLAAGQHDRESELVHLVSGFDEDLPRALTAWVGYQRRFPRYFLARQIVAYFLTNRGDVRDRLARFDAALALDDRHAVTYLDKSDLLLHQGRLDEAEAVVAAGRERRPTSSWLLGQRARVRLARGDLAAARPDFEGALAHGAPFGAHLAYAALLLQAGDEEARRGEVLVLQKTRSPEDRALFLCHHALALTRRGRAAEAAPLFAESARTAREARHPGTLLRCALLESMAGEALGRFAPAQARLAETQAVFASVLPLGSKDAHDARRLINEQRGVLHAELGELGEARAAERELGLAKEESAELHYRLALAERRAVEVPEPSPDALVFPRVRRRLLRARMLEQAGRVAEASAAYAAVAADRAACMNGERMADFPCGGHVASALVRGAALAARAGQPADARRDLATFHALWPDADADLPAVRDAAELDRTLPR